MTGAVEKVAGGREWLTVPEVVEFTGTPRRTVYNWIADGTVRSQKFRRHTYVNIDDASKAESKERRGRPRNDTPKPIGTDRKNMAHS